MPEIFWSVDSLVIKDNTLFGFGWVFHARHEIVAIRLRLAFAGSEGALSEYISADAGKPREDVERAFTSQPRALNSGFVVFGAFTTSAQIISIDLVCSLANDSIVELPVPTSRVVQFASATENNRLMRRQYYVFFKRGVQLLLSGNFRVLFNKVKRYLKGGAKTYLYDPAELADLFRPTELKNVCLILDHDLGGGANQYRDRLVDSIVKDGRTVIIFTFHVATLTHMLILRNSRLNYRVAIPDRTFILEAVKNLFVADIIYNTAVSFPKSEELPQLLINIKQATSARLTIFIHDFYLVCPSHFLIDNTGMHCHIPDMSYCASCLPNNQQGFTTLFFERDIVKWRLIWGALLAISDEIVTFSKKSSQLLLKAYPQIQGAKISVVPHEVNYLPCKSPQITNTNSLRIGVVGHIGFHKGSLFIQALAREIIHRGVDVKIVVIGMIEASCEPLVVTQTGPYQHDDLPDMIERSGANVFLFSSIWPETFSYVVHELVKMDLPVASFNIGAPAERLASYPKGLVLDSMEPGSVLENLILFHRNIYNAN